VKQFSENDGGTGSSAGTFFIGMFAGAAIGAGLALWFAPKSGVEMREQLAGTARDMGNRVSKTVTEVSTRGREAFDRAREVMSTASDQLDSVTAEAAKTLERGRRAVHNVAAAAAERS
jgi:gas vesicle protein